jgi:hypothetical protein
MAKLLSGQKAPRDWGQFGHSEGQCDRSWPSGAASDLADHTTGASIVVYGGMTLYPGFAGA